MIIFDLLVVWLILLFGLIIWTALIRPKSDQTCAYRFWGILIIGGIIATVGFISLVAPTCIKLANIMGGWDSLFLVSFISVVPLVFIAVVWVICFMITVSIPELIADKMWHGRNKMKVGLLNNSN